MLTGHFYHERIRKSVAVFGSLFNDIYIFRKTASGVGQGQMKVPLSYGPRSNFLTRIAEMANGEEAERQLAIRLPRMSFEMLGLNYDPIRKLPTNNSTIQALATPGSQTSRTKMFTAVPYNLLFQLNIYGKTQDDALQITEQILPYFNPQYTVRVKPIDDVPAIIDDVPVVLQGVTFSDDYEGSIEQRRTILYTLDFEMKVNFYGPVAAKDIVTEVQTSLFRMDTGLSDSDDQLSTLTTVATPSGVGPDSDFSLVTTIS